MLTILANKSPGRWAWSLSRLFRWYGVVVSAAVLVLTVTGDARADGRVHWEERMVVEAALKSSVPPELALAVAQAGVRPGRGRFDGRVGTMRISPALALAEFGVRAHGLRTLKANAGLGIALLERLHRRYGERWDLALSHYRGGPLARCESGPIAHPHTLGYVADVLEWWRRNQKDGKVTAMIREVRKYGAGASRFSGAEGRFSQRAAGTDRVWYDADVRTETPPFGEDRPYCEKDRFF